MKPSNQSKLAPIDDVPYTVLYDGDCGICQSGVALLAELDSKKLTRPTPLSEDVLRNLGNNSLSMSECIREMHVVSSGGTVYVGYLAMLQLAQLFPRTRMIARLARWCVPVPLGRFLYRLVANNRYRLSKCESGSCSLEHKK